MKDEKKSKSMVEYGEYLSLGTEIFAPILAGALIGHFWLDAKYHTTPLWTLILTLFGFVVGMNTMFKFVRKMNKKKK